MIRRVLIVSLCALFSMTLGCDEEESDHEDGDEPAQLEEQSQQDGDDQPDPQQAQADQSDELDAADKGIEWTTKPSTVVTWEELDDASRYVFERDGEELGTSMSDSKEFLGSDSFDDVEVTGETFRGEEVGQTEIVSTEESEKRALQWDEDAFDQVFIGRHISTEHSTSTGVKSVDEMPHVITADPEDIEILVIGDKMEEGGSYISAPFEFDDDNELVEHGPYIEVPVP